MSRISKKKAETLVSAYLITTFMLFAVRDSMSGVMRYAFSLVHLDFLWFVVDAFAMGATIIFFIQQFSRRNPLGIAICLSFVFSLVVSVFTTNDTIGGFFSSIKMFLPLLAGMSLSGTVLEERKWPNIILHVVFVASVIGLILNPYISYPWVGQTFNTLGVERQATRLWWVEGGIVRYGGLAGDSTMAGYFCAFLYMLLARQHRLLVNVVSWPIIYWALNTSTSKTATGVFFIAILLYLFQYFLGNNERRIFVMRKVARFSFLFILVPVVLIIFTAGMDLTEISPKLFSLQDRINNTWQEPYILMAEMFPWTIFTGCGMGCMCYPIYYTSYAQLYIPLDNFYLMTLLMMGPSTIFLLIAQYKSAGMSRDTSKLAVIFLFNIYSITVQCYGPSFATMMFGYMFSDVFALRSRTELRLKPILQRFGSSDSLASFRPLGRPAE